MEYVFIWFVFGGLSSLIASNKGYDGCGYFILGLLLGPIALLIAILNPNRKGGQIKPVGKHKCSFCGFDDDSGAPFCPACGLDKKGFNKDHYKRLALDKRYKAEFEKNAILYESEANKKDNKIWFIIVGVVIAAFLITVIVGNMRSREESEDSFFTKKHANRAEKYEWAKEDFKDERILKQYGTLYQSLKEFRYDREFQSNGFEDPLFSQWMQRVKEIENSKNKEFLERRGLSITDLKALGIRFLMTKGLEDSLTTAIEARYDSAVRIIIQQMDGENPKESSTNAEPLETPNKKRKSNIKSSSYRNCHGTFNVNGLERRSDDVTLIVTNKGSGVYEILFYIKESENFYFDYKYQKTIGSTHYYNCIDCGYNETSVVWSSTKLSDFAKGRGGILGISITEPYSEMKVTISTY